MDTDGGVEALISVANEAAGVSSEDLRDQLTTQIDKVNQKPTAGNVGQLNATVQAVNDQANTPVAQPNAAVQTANDQALATGNQASAVGKPENTSTNQANASMNPVEVAGSLQGKGIPSHKIDTLAEAIVARVNGQELTQTQREVLRSELGTPAVQRVINELIQKKSNGIDKAHNNVYDDSDFRGGFAGEEESASWNDAKPEAPLTAQRRLLSSDDADASVADELSDSPEQNMSSEETDNPDLEADILGNGQSIDNMAELYAEKVKSNRKWRWKDAFPNAGKLSKGDKSSIKKRAIEKGLIPDVPVKVVKASNKKTYRYVDFDVAGLVKEKMKLPEYLWAETDKVQFKWLDEQIGGRPRGYTWHHSEADGQMELVPTGIHRIYHHNGGRTKNHWAYREGGR